MFDNYTKEQRIAFCQALANLCASDNKVTEEERNELEGLILGAGLSPTDPEVSSVIENELKNPGQLSDILRRVSNRKLNAGLFRIFIEIACVDGDVAPEERAKIQECASTFGFNSKAADELLDWTLQTIQLEKRGPEILGRL